MAVKKYRVIEGRRRLGFTGDVLSLEETIAERYLNKGLLEQVNEHKEEKDVNEGTDTQCE